MSAGAGSAGGGKKHKPCSEPSKLSVLPWVATRLVNEFTNDYLEGNVNWFFYTSNEPVTRDDTKLVGGEGTESICVMDIEIEWFDPIGSKLNRNPPALCLEISTLFDIPTENEWEWEASTNMRSCYACRNIKTWKFDAGFEPVQRVRMWTFDVNDLVLVLPPDVEAERNLLAWDMHPSSYSDDSGCRRFTWQLNALVEQTWFDEEDGNADVLPPVVIVQHNPIVWATIKKGNANYDAPVQEEDEEPVTYPNRFIKFTPTSAVDDVWQQVKDLLDDQENLSFLTNDSNSGLSLQRWRYKNSLHERDEYVKQINNSFRILSHGAPFFCLYRDEDYKKLARSKGGDCYEYYKKVMIKLGGYYDVDGDQLCGPMLPHYFENEWSIADEGLPREDTAHMPPRVFPTRDGWFEERRTSFLQTSRLPKLVKTPYLVRICKWRSTHRNRQMPLNKDAKEKKTFWPTPGDKKSSECPYGWYITNKLNLKF